MPLRIIWLVLVLAIVPQVADAGSDQVRQFQQYVALHDSLGKRVSHLPLGRQLETETGYQLTLIDQSIALAMYQSALQLNDQELCTYFETVPSFYGLQPTERRAFIEQQVQTCVLLIEDVVAHRAKFLRQSQNQSPR